MRVVAKGGLLCVVSSPSGGGKTSVIYALLKKNPHFGYSVSATTRTCREGEEDGTDYYFLSDKEFDKNIRQEGFIEWAEVHGFRYGTLKKPIDEMVRKGKIILLDIDVVGGMNVRKSFPDSSLLIFLMPPSEQALIDRLKDRNSESPEQIEKRLSRLSMEMSYADKYDMRIINDEFDETVEKVQEAILAHLARLEVKTDGQHP